MAKQKTKRLQKDRDVPQSDVEQVQELTTSPQLNHGSALSELDSLTSSHVRRVADDLSSDAKYRYEFGSPVIDVPFGGGLYSGKVYECYGWESVGKSTLCLEMTKAFERFWKINGQALGKKHVVLWIEAESALDKVRAKWMGCSPENWLILESETIEETEENIVATLKKAEELGFVVFIVWDTIAAVPTRAEKDTGFNSGGMAGKPRAVRSMFRKVVPLLGKTDSTMVLVNQLNQSFTPNVADETPLPGIRFYASVRVRMTKRMEERHITPTGDEITTGICTELKFDKNKLIQRGQKSLVVIDNERGFNILDTNLRYLKKAKLANVKGAGWVELSVPERLYSPDNPEPIRYEDVKFQTVAKMQEIIETRYPHMLHWINYLIFRNYTVASPLIKVKIIKHVWDYERMFFGKLVTQLTEEERSAASILYHSLESEE